MKTAKSPFLVLTFIFVVVSMSGSAEESLLLNGDFETGAHLPEGWSPVEPGTAGCESVWLHGESHTGSRALGAKSVHARAAWTSAPVAVEPGKRYIVSGFIKPASGTARLCVEFRDARGNRLGRSSTTPVATEPESWTYVAVETTAAGRHGADGSITARVLFWVRGEAALDDVALHPLAPCELANNTIEAPLDSKGRIPYWSGEKDLDVLDGARGGTVVIDTENACDGAGCLAVTASGDWYGATSAPYGVWPWWKRLEMSALARCTPDAELLLGIAWFDSAQKFIGAGMGAFVTTETWQRVSSGQLSPPDNAHTFKPLLLVRKKKNGQAQAWFDVIEVRVEEKPCVRVVVNQVGYDLHAPKQAIVLTNFFPRKKAFGQATALDSDGATVWQSPIVCSGRMYGQSQADWGWYVWRADFSKIDRPGTYHVTASFGSRKAESVSFAVDSDLLFKETAAINVDFFFVQRCGIEVPGWHAPCHLDDAKLSDGAHRDLTGGWHSAGDYNKLSWEYGDGGVLYALIHAAAAVPQYFAPYDRDKDGVPDVIDEAEWGAKYLVKIQEADGGLLNHIEQGPDRQTWMNWCPPEKTTDNVVGTPDDPIVREGEGNSPLAIGGWALLGSLNPDKDGHNPYLAYSVKLWEQATGREKTPGNPLLLLSAIDLYKITREDRYLEYGRRTVDTLLASGNPDGALAGGYGNTGDVPAAALATFALEFPDDPLVPAIKARLEKHLPAFLDEADNPLGLMMQQPGPQGYFFDPSSAMGCNYQFSSRAWSAIMVYRVIHDDRAMQYATDQLDFLLGRNPYNICMMEGKGTVNLPRYHHRYITIPGHPRGAVPGTIPNGCVRDIAGRDRPGLDLSTGGRQYPSYRTNEPWLVHNVLYTLAITALHEAAIGFEPLH
ncbi:MAG TPA: glycoside hydrolase family 9 protein [Candidatus Bathyarchaeia archaeon]|nr:glycoside hydrolase family 9 protein [Candidatus Bathyarchaeia archaeon]